MNKLRSIDELKEYRDSLNKVKDPKKVTISVCGGTGCLALGAESVINAFLEKIKEHKLENVGLVVTGCPGFCERGPVVVILPKQIFYQKVTIEDVEDIISSTIKDEVVERLLYCEADGKKIIYENEVPFYAKQKRIVLANNGRISPTKISDYIELDGYSALAKALKGMSPTDVIEEVKASGLRGRGGAGFPTGLKWEFCRKAKGEPKYLICNADEGDPGAFMDRAVLEGNPHLVIEGMLIAAYAIGSEQGYVYVRAEYPLAIKNIKSATAQAEEMGLLGKNILGTNFSFSLKIKEGAGAFVCGEETALIASIEGKRGMPHPRPPFPAQSGLWEKPTNINNVETFANIQYIILESGKEYAKLGTETSKGTKVFALSGKINNTGLIEVPMGTTLKEVIFEIGGGIPKGKKFKAVQLGGPSGGCLTTQHLDLPIDYETLVGAGAMMGSGGMVVMDEDNCMIEIARFFMEFTQNESCGKCTPCRIGTKRMLEILTRITEGDGKEEDIDTLIKMAKTIKDTSLCGLGQTAPNPILSTITNFRKEYEDHIKQKRCSAYVCEKLYTAPCSDTCPAQTEVYSYVALIAEERFDEALELIKEKNPFPSICGRICYHPCEAKCKRAEIDKPLALRALKRFVSDRELELERIKPKPVSRFARPEKIAVIGAGSAGLTCAYYLAKRGYSVTVFEALETPGGMLAVGIPGYRFNKRILRAEIEDIVALGIEIRTKTEVGKDIRFDEIKEEYNAVFIAIGAGLNKKMRIEGEDGKGVISGLTFLQNVNLGLPIEIGERIAVIGGGFCAMDSARQARKLGASEVSLICMRSKKRIVNPEEVITAENEGIKIESLTFLKRILRENGKVKGIECLKMRLTDFFDKDGKRVAEQIIGSEFIIDVDMVIIAIGRRVSSDFLEGKIELYPEGTIRANNETLGTSLTGVFAGGDAVTGAATVIEAIAAGNRAGKGIDRYLNNGIDSEVIKRRKRQAMPTLITTEKKMRSEKEGEFTANMAIKEAKRCLRCYEKE
ncbi:MAG: NADH-quinone oxidoreductase subunit NuoF [bacterium]|nr:NADH-quinone oxidoreductase subunit NuoF [bacterium]